MMSVSSACASGRRRNLAAQQAGHHLDAGERILHLVGDHGGHLADGGQTVAQPFALFELLDARQVLEEHRRADDVAVVVAHERERVADHLALTASAASRRGSAGGAVRRRAVSTRTTSGWSFSTSATGWPMSPACGSMPNTRYASSLMSASRAVARDRQHAVAHAGDDVPEEGVVDAARREARRAGRGRAVARHACRQAADRSGECGLWSRAATRSRRASRHARARQRGMPQLNAAAVN